MVIFVCDTREQRPYDWPGRCVRARLEAGDYSVVGLETAVSVERKTVEDFAKTVIRSKDRFREELIKLTGYRAACIVVEGSIQDVLEQRYTGAASPAAILGASLAIQMDFRIPVVWAGDRQHARHFTEKFLERAAKRYTPAVVSAPADLAIHSGKG